MVVESEPGNFWTCSGTSCGHLVSFCAAASVFAQAAATSQKFHSSGFNITLFDCFWRDVYFHLAVWTAGVVGAGTVSPAKLDSICWLTGRFCLDLPNIASAFQGRACNQNFNTAEVSNEKQEV